MAGGARGGRRIGIGTPAGQRASRPVGITPFHPELPVGVTPSPPIMRCHTPLEQTMRSIGRSEPSWRQVGTREGQ